MIIYELIQCEIDERNHTHNDKHVAFFASTQNVVDYLSHDGKSSDKISIVGHSDNDISCIKANIESPNAIIKVHTSASENPLIGFSYPSYDTYYYCLTHEVRNFGFSKTDNPEEDNKQQYRTYIGKRIAEERAKLGLSQRDLAGLSGYDPATIAKIELGRWSAGIDVLGRIAEAMGLKVDLVHKCVTMNN